MSDLLTQPSTENREPLQPWHADESNPLGLDGIEFIEYATARPQALGHVLEMMGFRPVARHRSREVLLYRQGALNIVINAHPPAGEGEAALPEAPEIAAMAVRVRDARAAYQDVIDRGAWEVQTHPEVMELNIPAVHGVGRSQIYFVDRWREFSIYDVDFVPIPGVDRNPPPIEGIHFFGVVQYIGFGRSEDWIEFYEELFNAQRIPDDERYGIMPAGHLMRFPSLEPGNAFMLQLVEPPPDALDAGEYFQRVGLGVPDVMKAAQALRARGMEFVESPAAHTEARGALTRSYLGGVVFELVHDE